MKVSIKQYAQTLFDLTEGKSEQEILEVVEKFANQLKKDGQIRNARKIIEKFVELYNGANGIVGATVISAHNLSSGQIEKVENFVKEKYSAKKVEIKNDVSEKIKGGIIVKVGDEIMDGSIENQLKKLGNILSK